MSNDTCLADLLKLNLHNFEDEVRNIVDKANKEQKMEQALKDLEVTWSQMEFEYEKHERTGLKLIKASEELIEILEDNQVQLQNYLLDKFVAFFLEQFTSWQKRLSIVDSVIAVLTEVQRTWSHLESIFIGSADIRAQLPKESELFDEIDSTFKENITEMVKFSNVVESCNLAGLLGRIEDIQSRLTVCEKALAEYLDTKRLAFPRFYFISSVDLLDILSKGNNPQAVAKHLAKLFDNVAALKFKEEEGGVPSKHAVGMYSKEKEYVDLFQNCECVGQVEIWLNRLMDRTHETVRETFADGVVSYEEKAREQWIFDYPAQVALAVTQIWWTTEVGLAFSRLEEGYENAMRDYFKKQVQQLHTLIAMLLTDLNKGDRQKIMTICTIGKSAFKGAV